MQKRSVSHFILPIGKGGVLDVVATVLIVMLTVAAISIVWIGVMPLIRDKIGGSDVCNSVDVSIENSQGYTCYKPNNITVVQIKKGSNDVNISELKFFLSSGGNSVSYAKDVSFERNSYYSFYLNTSRITKLEKVEVVTVVKSGNAKKDCASVFVENVGVCGSAGFSASEIAQLINETNANPPIQNVLPTINIFSPINNSVYTTSLVWLNVSSDQVVDWKFSLNGASNVSFNPNISLPPLVNGNYNITVYANNSNGMSSKYLDFTINIPCATQNAQGFFNGTGSLASPYGICNCTMLQNMKNYLGSNFSLLNDISCNLFSGFVSIGDCGLDGNCILSTDNHPFTGNFNGNNLSVSGLIINTPAINGTGLFACSKGNVISDFRIIDANMNGGIWVGILAGHMSSVNISNVYTTGKLTSVKYAGGLVGLQTAGNIVNSYSNVSVWCSDASCYAGGITGSSSGDVNNSYAIGNVTGAGSMVGGLIGYKTSGFIYNSYAMGNVTAQANGGGLVGYFNNGGIINSYSTGSVTGSWSGLIGYKYSIGPTVTSSFWDKETSGQDFSSGGTGKTTVQMKNQTVFTNAGWDFTSKWTIDSSQIKNNGYPYLIWQNL